MLPLFYGRVRPRLVALLRFQRYQLPAWAHTQQGPGLAPTPAATTATATTATATTATSSPTKPPEMEVGSDATVAAHTASDGVGSKYGNGGVHDSSRGGDGDAGDGVGEDVTAGDAVVEGRDSPPPVLAALVSGIGVGIGVGAGSFSRARDRRDSSSCSSSKNDLSYSSSNEIRTTPNAVEATTDSKENTAAGPSYRNSGTHTGESPPVRPPPPPPVPTEEAEAEAACRCAREQNQQQQHQQESSQSSEAWAALHTADNNPTFTTTAATTASRVRKYSFGTAASNGGGRVAAKPQAWCGVRREGSGSGAGTGSGAYSAAAAAPTTAGASKGSVLAAARGRWDRRGVPKEEVWLSP